VTHKLLLADDSLTIQRVVELTFAGEDVEVVAVGDGEQAIARIPIERPDVVLADIGMPKRSGYDVAAFVKGHPDLSHIPVLLLAGAFEPVDEARAQQVRCDGVLVKPFEPQQVVARVRALFARQDVAAPPPSPPPTQERPAEPNRRSEEYFDDLDAALTARGRDHGVPARAASYEPKEAAVPTIEEVLFAEPSPSVSLSQPRDVTAVTGANRGATESSRDAVAVAERPNVIADVFAALFAAEQGGGVPTLPVTPATPAGPVVSEALVDEVTRRVLERLAPDAARGLVTQIVTDVAERLVRDEIGRIKTGLDGRR
jgi:CheY-like chemotaxis protein